jgi:HEAT repeat protein
VDNLVTYDCDLLQRYHHSIDIDCAEKIYPPSTRLQDIPDRIFNTFSKIVLDSKRDPEIRASAADSLGEIGKNLAEDTLAKVLEDPEYIVRKSAITALGKVGKISTSTTEKLLEVCTDGDPDIRATAANTLGKIGDPIAIKTLVDALKPSSGNYNQFVAYKSAIALGSLKAGDRVLSVLLETLEKDDSPLARRNAVFALGYLGKSLMKLTDEPGKTVSDKAIEALIKFTEDPDGDVSDNAIQALEEIYALASKFVA